METFHTRGGRCVVTTDALEVKKSELHFTGRYWSRSKPRTLVALTVFVLLPLALLFADPSLFPIVLGLVVVGYGLRFPRDYRRVDRIPLEDVVVVERVGGVPLAVPRLAVWYHDGVMGGFRYVQFPPRWFGGDDDLERATAVLRERGLPVQS